MDDFIKVPRTDPAYNAHGYLTKVPVGAIIPFMDQYTQPGDLVVDLFAGSGMTAVAAKMCSRSAIVSDISVLGRHIGTGYLTQVNADQFRQTARSVVNKSRSEVGYLYQTPDENSEKTVEQIRTIWSLVYKCLHCEQPINYFNSFKTAGWSQSEMKCPHCDGGFVKKGAELLGDEPVAVVIKPATGKQLEKPVSQQDLDLIEESNESDVFSRFPSFPIDQDREMYRRSALEKWGLTETKKFFSARNATVLLDVWTRISELEDEALKKKMQFAFTAILPRASKRYQWSPKAPLNAANQHYYISPVFFEWNVYDLLLRKVEACIKSDIFVHGQLPETTVQTSQTYLNCSADRLSHLEDASVDYIFTDPPFGSNIFYADMNLFQEAWLKQKTEHSNEAVIRTTGKKDDKKKSELRYQELLTNAFREAHRVLKAGGRLSIVFGNSKGSIWAMAQQAFQDAGFNSKPEAIHILDKGQRSVKGLSSGKENVATLDLIVTIKKGDSSIDSELLGKEPDELIDQVLDKIDLSYGMTASHVYLEVLRTAIASSISMSAIDLSHVLSKLELLGFRPDRSTGILLKVDDPVITTPIHNEELETSEMENIGST